MSIIEIIAVLFSLACVWLAVKKNVWNWPLGLIAVSAYLIVFFQAKLYADMLLQILFFVQGIIGWVNWSKGKDKSLSFEPTTLSRTQLLTVGILIIAITTLLSYLLIRFTDASTPIPDALATTLSLIANWLLIKKIIENWIFWIAVNLLYIGLFWYKELYLSSGVYVIFFILALKGFIDWKQKNATKKASL